MKRPSAAMIGLCALGVHVSAFAGPTKGGAELAAMCAACHRLDETKGVLSITGRSTEDLIRVLESFQKGDGHNHIMSTVCRSLSDQEIVTIARYLESIGTEAAHQ